MIQERPRNFQAGFVSTWSNNNGLLLTDTKTGAICRIVQSGLSAWWVVMKRCAAAGLDAGIAREWLDRAEGRHYADALADAVLGAEVGPFEFQASRPRTRAEKPAGSPATHPPRTGGDERSAVSSTIDAKDAAVLKLAALACRQIAGRSKHELDEFAAETQTEMQPPEEAMERINRLVVGLTRPLATSCTKNHYDIEYTGAKDEAHLVCAALVVRLFELLGMPSTRRSSAPRACSPSVSTWWRRGSA